MKKAFLSVCAALLCLLPSCGAAEKTAGSTSAEPVGITVYGMSPTKEGTARFEKKLKASPDYVPAQFFEDDECYLISPREMTEKYGFEIYKYDKCTATYLFYENKVYTLGESFGGLGAVSFAVADLDLNDMPELYYTYSSGSGMHRSQAGYFDTATDTYTNFEYIMPDTDMVLKAGTDRLELYTAEVSGESFVDISLTPTAKAGEILLLNGTVSLIAPEKEEESTKI